jgi:hypothetical protein
MRRKMTCSPTLGRLPMVREPWYISYQWLDAVERSPQDGSDKLGTGFASD